MNAERDCTDLEHRLMMLWQRVLDNENIGLSDNYFEIGGDSITAMHLVAAARSEGLRFSPLDVLRYVTIAQLAPHVTIEDREAWSQSRQPGVPTNSRVPLTPIQEWFFEQDLADKNFYYQSVLLQCDDVDTGSLQKALDLLVERHDALRERFVERADGTWVAAMPQVEYATVPLRVVDLAGVEPPAVDRQLNAATDEAQALLDLGEGRLLAACLFRIGAGRPDRLLVAVHHVAMDVLSWRPLLEDLGSAYQALVDGRAVELPVATTSFRAWAEQLNWHAAGAESQASLDHWLQTLSGSPKLPRDNRSGANTVASARTVRACASPEVTRTFLRSAPAAYLVRPEEILVAALAALLAEWTGDQPVVLELEGHGREELAEQDNDLSRTVGWFTAFKPVRVEPPAATDSRDEYCDAMLKSVKESIRGMPANGLGFGLLRYTAKNQELVARPKPRILVNYLGKIGNSVPDVAPFTVVPGTFGLRRAASHRRSHEIEIVASVVDESLQVKWSFCGESYEDETIQRLADAFIEQVAEFSAYCVAHPGGHTASDFPLARLTQSDIDHIVRRHPDVEDIYPLTPLQEGMLFEGLLDPDARLYFQQQAFTLSGQADLEEIGEVWRRVQRRHPALRTTVSWENVEEPVQIVHSASELDIRFLDWTGQSPLEHERLFDELLRAERQEGMDIESAPPVRVTLIRCTPSTAHLLLSSHHLVLDGWSSAAVIAEVMAECRGSRSGAEPDRASVVPFRRYVHWLEGRDTRQSHAYWRQALAGFEPPASAPKADGRDAGHVLGAVRVDHELRAGTSADIRRAARAVGVTTNVFCLAALALLIAKDQQSDDVMLGVTVSGRPAELPGVQSIVGMLANTLPFRIRTDRVRPLAGWLRAVQRSHVEMQAHEHTSLAEIQRATNLPPGRRLFTCLYAFANYPRAADDGQAPRAFEICRLRAVEDTGYPLAIDVEDEERIKITATCRGDAHDLIAVSDLLERFEKTLGQMVADLSVFVQAEPVVGLNAESRHMQEGE